MGRKSREGPIRGLAGACCVRCRVRLEACVCDVLAAHAGEGGLATGTPLHLVLHAGEAKKSTNTGYLAARALAGSVVHLHGREGRAIAPRPRALVLTPEGRPLAARDAGRPVFVIDAAWRQARRMRRKLPALVEAEPVRLAPGPPSRYALRVGPTPAHLSTLEAVARAWGVLEGPAHREALEAILDVFVERSLALRGVKRSG